MVEFIETTTFSVAVISTSGSMSATLITFGTAPLHFLKLKIDFAKLSFIMKIREGRKRLTKTSAGRNDSFRADLRM